MHVLCRLYIHDFAAVDLGRDYGHSLECRRCRFQIRNRSATATVAVDPATGPGAAASQRRA